MSGHQDITIVTIIIIIIIVLIIIIIIIIIIAMTIAIDRQKHPAFLARFSEVDLANRSNGGAADRAKPPGGFPGIGPSRRAASG